LENEVVDMLDAAGLVGNPSETARINPGRRPSAGGFHPPDHDGNKD